MGRAERVEAEEEGALAREARRRSGARRTPASPRRSPPRRWRAGSRGGSRAGARRGPARSRAAPPLRCRCRWRPATTSRIPMSARTASRRARRSVPACVSRRLPVSRSQRDRRRDGERPGRHQRAGWCRAARDQTREAPLDRLGDRRVEDQPAVGRVVVGDSARPCARRPRDRARRRTLRPPALRKHGAQPPAPAAAGRRAAAAPAAAAERRAEHPVAAQSGERRRRSSGRRGDPERPPEGAVGRLGLDPRLGARARRSSAGQPLRRLALAGRCARAVDRAELVEQARRCQSESRCGTTPAVARCGTRRPCGGEEP